MVKKIDAKIAEIEKEEENAREESTNVSVNDLVPSDSIKTNSDTIKTATEVKENDGIIITNNDLPDKNLNDGSNGKVTTISSDKDNDEFFDDFFADE